MFFILSKTLDWLLSPISWVVLIALFAWWSRRRPPRWAWLRWLSPKAPLLLAVLVWILGSEAVSNRLVRALEASAEITQKPGHVYDAVVLLGGMVEDRADSQNGVSYNDNVERLLVTYEVLRRGEARRVIVSGGSWGDTPAEARTLGDELVRLGVEPERIVLEEESKNTRENAERTASIVRREGMQSLLLVTSAFHMARAQACFVAADLQVDTLPADYKSYDPARFSGSFLPRSKHFHESSWALRELAGRLIYRLVGFGG